MSKKFEDTKKYKIKKGHIAREFFDINGNKYSFEYFIDFVTFWFNAASRKTLKHYFPDFEKLQNYAANSKIARMKIN